MPSIDVGPPGFPQQIVNTTTNIPPEVTDFFGGYIGLVAVKRCVLHVLAENTNIPAKSGTTLVIPTYKVGDMNTIPYIEEGKTPAGLELQRDLLKITPKMLGEYTKITTNVIWVVQDQVLHHAAQTLGLRLALACDKAIADALDQTQDVIYGTGGVQTGALATPGYIQGSDIVAATSFLKKNLALKIAPNLFGSTFFGSTPVNEAYYCFCNYQIESDLYSIPGFSTFAHYGSSVSAHGLPGEVGAYLNARFISTHNLLYNDKDNGATAAAPHLFHYFLGRGAYYITRLGFGSTQFLVNPTGSGANGDDPMHLKASVGYKSWFGASINKTNKWLIKMITRTRLTIKP